MRFRRAHVLTLALVGLALAAPIAPAAAPPYAPGKVLVRLKGSPERALKLPAGMSVPEALRRLRADPDVAYANPDYVVTAAGSCAFPNDPGTRGFCGHWRDDQWNFLAPAQARGGVDVPGAWQNLKANGTAGAKGITVAVLDTGVAYRTKGRRFRRDPDLPPRKRFVHPRDFVDHDRLPLDEDGHGTHVASTIAQSTNNGIGLTGVAYGVDLMPIRVLNRREQGTGRNVARGIRFAVRYGADVINLSLEFKRRVTKCVQIVGVCEAVQRAFDRGIVVVAAAGNQRRGTVSFPAAANGAIAVGATTYRSCLAEYSDYGTGLDLVAPGGGEDTATGTGNPLCSPAGRPFAIRQFSLKPGTARRGYFRRFGIVGLHGTSMAAAHVSGTAAMMLAGCRRPPDTIKAQLRGSSRDVGWSNYYGAGLLDAAKATSSGPCP